jgi:hypothetical protein
MAILAIFSTGAYAQLHLKFPTSGAVLMLPANALIFQSDGLRAAIVAGDKIALKPVALGRDFGTQVEVVSGLREVDAVVVNPPDSLAAGQKVRIAAPSAKGESK